MCGTVVDLNNVPYLPGVALSHYIATVLHKVGLALALLDDKACTGHIVCRV